MAAISQKIKSILNTTTTTTNKEKIILNNIINKENYSITIKDLLTQTECNSIDAALTKLGYNKQYNIGSDSNGWTVSDEHSWIAMDQLSNKIKSFNKPVQIYSVSTLGDPEYLYQIHEYQYTAESDKVSISTKSLETNIIYKANNFVDSTGIAKGIIGKDLYFTLGPVREYFPYYQQEMVQHTYNPEALTVFNPLMITKLSEAKSFINQIKQKDNILTDYTAYDWSQIYIELVKVNATSSASSNDNSTSRDTLLEDDTLINYTETLIRGSSPKYSIPSSVNTNIPNPFNCTLNIYHGSSLSTSLVLPVYPNEVTDSNSVTFTPTTVLNRSVNYQTYNTSSRSLSFSLELHEEIIAHSLGDSSEAKEISYNYIHYLVSTIQSACYPNYLSYGYTDPPEISVSIGDHFYIRGILDNCSAQWSAPIINGKLVNCSLSLGIKETTGPYTGNEVAKMMGKRL